MLLVWIFPFSWFSVWLIFFSLCHALNKRYFPMPRPHIIRTHFLTHKVSKKHRYATKCFKTKKNRKRTEKENERKTDSTFSMHPQQIHHHTTIPTRSLELLILCVALPLAFGFMCAHIIIHPLSFWFCTSETCRIEHASQKVPSMSLCLLICVLKSKHYHAPRKNERERERW